MTTETAIVWSGDAELICSSGATATANTTLFNNGTGTARHNDRILAGLDSILLPTGALVRVTPVSLLERHDVSALAERKTISECTFHHDYRVESRLSSH